MWATYKLINSYFWKTIYGPILSFIFPILLLTILGNIMKIQYIYPGIIAISILFIGGLALPLAILELKGSSLFKYIGSSPINPMKFSFVIIFYYIFIVIITGFIILFTTMFIFYNDVFVDSGFKYGILGGIITINGFFSFCAAIFLHLILVISFGLVIATFSKTPQQALTISFVVIIPTMFLSGMIISVDIIAESKFMQWTSRISPFRYTTGNLVVATTPINQLGDLFQNLSIDNKELIFNLDIINAKTGNLNIEFKDFLKSTDSKENKNLIYDVKSSKELIKFVKTYETHMRFNEKMFVDRHLYDLVFSRKSALYSSDNNIFNWSEPWVVRRTPVSSEIKEFIKNFLEGPTNKGKGFIRYAPIIAKILGNDLEFLSIFFKQSNILYTKIEKILNIILPLVLTGCFINYIINKFNWTNR